ncbi:MAG TPA: signal transduction histidine kinase [Cytophagales bacterium]|nr:signal transduction histidine kinase [Cytophagales bacterium]HAP59081.1 signal transduction histidine kinase [Cytophagales bacterium]
MFNYRYRYLYILLLAAYSFFNILVLNGDRLYTVGLPWYELLPIVLVQVTLIWEANRLIGKHWARRVPAHPLAVQFVLSIAWVFLQAFLSVELTYGLLGDPYGNVSGNFRLSLAFTFRINLFLNSVNAIVYFNHKYREERLAAEQYRTQTAQARLTVLANQISPHFFFNSLNVLTELIRQQPPKAESFVQKLASVYRYSLRFHQEELVTLQQEMEILQEYLALLEVRFQDSLQSEIAIDPAEKEKMLPPLSMQMLVENVVKHNAATRIKPLSIRVFTDGSAVVVENTLRPKRAPEASTGIGLNNIRERYEFLGETIAVAKTDTHFSVRLPLVDP